MKDAINIVDSVYYAPRVIFKDVNAADVAAIKENLESAGATIATGNIEIIDSANKEKIAALEAEIELYKITLQEFLEKSKFFKLEAAKTVSEGLVATAIAEELNEINERFSKDYDFIFVDLHYAIDEAINQYRTITPYYESFLDIEDEVSGVGADMTYFPFK